VTFGTPILSRPEELAELLGIAFTDEQLAAITAPLAPAVIVAGAGSGKTTVMAARVVWLVGIGAVAPEEVLGLTFTNKAAAELAHRVRDTLARAALAASSSDHSDEVAGEPVIATYHAFAGRLLADHGLRIGIEPGCRLLTDATRYQLAARVLRRAPGPFPALTQPFSQLVADLVALDGELAEHLVDPQQLREHDQALLAELGAVPKPHAPVRAVIQAAAKRIELSRLADDYRAAKRERDLLDFSDQVALAATLAEQRPEVGEIERKRAAVVLLDEYQDTSIAQRRLLAGLFGDGHPVTAVGDPCQAIYGWRGASTANLDQFPTHFPTQAGQPAARYTLTENRRSGGRLLGFANELSWPLRDRHPGVAPLRPAPGAKEKGWLRCALLSTYADEISWVADRVAELIANGTPQGEIAILVRAGSDIPALYEALTSRDLPVDVVGLSGLLHLPEVADLVTTLEVLDDPTSNAALVRLLTGPRWRIGPRDLVLLGRQARDLVQLPEEATGQDSALRQAVAGVDPTEVISLSDALEAPSEDVPYSPAARQRFAMLASEIRQLRRYMGESLLDLLHRVLAVTGLDVEVMVGSPGTAAQRRAALSTFLDAAASFADLEGDAPLPAFLAFLRASVRYDRGLERSAPPARNSVTLLTAHKAKGLEWDVVMAPTLSAKVFPSGQSRQSWTSCGHVLPHPLRGDAETLPEVSQWTNRGLAQFRELMREHDGLEELRLGYVAFTRPRSLLVASGHWWGPTQQVPRGPSEFLTSLRLYCEQGHGQVDQWADPPADGETNPRLDEISKTGHGWPRPLDPEALAHRRRAADLVRAALADQPAVEVATAYPTFPDEPGLSSAQRRILHGWDRDLAMLLEELRRTRTTQHTVALPASLSATQLLRLATDPDGLARELARPMPRPPAPAARRGTRFHAWVESLFAPRPLLEPDDLPGAADDDIVDEADFAALQEAFLRTPYACLRPYRIEEPFQLVLGGRVIRGRIDAVYQTPDGFEVVDWKTHRAPTADPLQLAIYRLACAELVEVPPEQVSAAFLYVRTGEVVRPANLPDRSALERLLTGEPGIS